MHRMVTRSQGEAAGKLTARDLESGDQGDLESKMDASEQASIATPENLVLGRVQVQEPADQRLSVEDRIAAMLTKMQVDQSKANVMMMDRLEALEAASRESQSDRGETMRIDSLEADRPRFPATTQARVPVGQQQPMGMSFYNERGYPGRTRTARMPAMKNLRLLIDKFDGSELYPGLGSGFASWGAKFLKQLELAEQISGVTWSEDLKMERLGSYLTGTAEKLFDRQSGAWWAQCPQLLYAMDRMPATYRVSIPQSKGMKMVMSKKTPKWGSNADAPIGRYHVSVDLQRVGAEAVGASRCHSN